MAGKKKAQKKVAEKSVPRGGVWNATADPDGVRKKLFPGMTKAQVKDKHKDVAQKMRMINEPPFTPFSEMNYLQKYEELKMALEIPAIYADHHREIPERERLLIEAFRGRETLAQKWRREHEEQRTREYITIIAYRLYLLEQEEKAHE